MVHTALRNHLMVLELEYDRSLLGKELPMGTFEVTRELIRSFCQAIGETNSIYTHEEAAIRAGHPTVIAPPTFCTIFDRRVPSPDLKLNFGGVGINAGQKVEMLAPVYAGDVLNASSYLKEVYPKTGRTGTMVFIVWVTMYTNQVGARVAEIQKSFAVQE